MALGATRIRVLRESLVESLLLAVGGGGLGAVLALGMTRAIGAYAPADLFGRITQIDSIRLNSTVLLFTIGLSILTGLLFGGIPGIQVTRLNIESVLRDASRTISQRTRLQHLLMAVEIAVSVLLTVAAGLLLRGFIHVVEIPSGYNAANLLTFTIDSPVGSPSANRIAPGASDATARIQFFQTLLDRISGIPEVQTAATSTYLPLTRLGLRVLLRVDGAPPEPIPQGMTPISAISPGYFRTMNIPLKQGRSFETTDDSRAPLVVIVSEAVARHFFGADNPIGRTVSLPGWTPEASSQSGSVVGVVADVRAAGPDQPIAPQIYIPYAQGPVWGTNTIIVRSRSSRKDLAATVREVVRSLDVDRPVYDVQTMDQRLDGVLSGRRFNLLLFGAFAVGAGLLAVAGVYSVITYIVSQRTHEIGIRMSLGAAKTDILSLFIREGLSWVIGGLVVGIALSISLTRAMSSLLFDISPTDFLTYSSVTSLILVVAAVACYIPARASAQVDPSIALREE
jgi:putative ABC transport system permease protein